MHSDPGQLAGLLEDVAVLGRVSKLRYTASKALQAATAASPESIEQVISQTVSLHRGYFNQLDSEPIPFVEACLPIPFLRENTNLSDWTAAPGR